MIWLIKMIVEIITAVKNREGDGNNNNNNNIFSRNIISYYLYK
jgi:hypothetical protein